MDSVDAAAAVTAPWQRIAGWLQRHAPGWVGQGGPQPLFNPPALPAALDALQARLGRALPPAQRALLATHDGCRAGDYPLAHRATDPTRWRTLGCAEVAQVWEMLCAIAAESPFPHPVRVSGPVQALWWSPAWVPLADCGTGDVVCLDTHPAPGGTPGQLVLYAHDVAERHWLGASLADWLGAFAADLEAGRYEHVPGIGLCSRGGLPAPRS